MRFFFLAFILLVGGGFTCLEAMGPPPEKKVKWEKNDLSHGYALLFGVTEKQRNLDMVLIVKTARKPTADLIKDITRTYEDLYDYLKSTQINAHSVPKLEDGLFLAERSSRERIERIKTGQLLSRSGPFFELTLLSTQAEALTYSSSLLSHIAEQDPSSANREKALAFQKKLERLLEKVWRQIESHVQ